MDHEIIYKIYWVIYDYPISAIKLFKNVFANEAIIQRIAQKTASQEIKNCRSRLDNYNLSASMSEIT